MRTVTRLFALFLALALLLLAAAALVSELLAAVADDATREPPGWWTDMVTGRSLLWGGLAALATGVLAAVCLIALVRMVSGARRDTVNVLPVGAADSKVTISRSALEGVLEGTLRELVAEFDAVSVTLAPRGGGLDATVLARVIGCDLAALHGRAVSALDQELERAGSPRLTLLELEILEIVEAASSSEEVPAS